MEVLQFGDDSEPISDNLGLNSDRYWWRIEVDRRRKGKDSALVALAGLNSDLFGLRRGLNCQGFQIGILVVQGGVPGGWWCSPAWVQQYRRG